MKIGISTASLFLKQETEDAVSTIKSLGADCVEIFYQTYYEYRPEFSRTLIDKLSGLEVNSVHVNTFLIEHSLFSPSRRVRGDAFYWLDQVMRSAQLLGCKAYSFHGVAGTDVTEYVARAFEFCARYGVKLCLENVAWCIYNKPGVFAQLKSSIPDLAGVFDIKQAPFGIPLRKIYRRDERQYFPRSFVRRGQERQNVSAGQGSYRLYRSF